MAGAAGRLARLVAAVRSSDRLALAVRQIVAFDAAVADALVRAVGTVGSARLALLGGRVEVHAVHALVALHFKTRIFRRHRGLVTAEAERISPS